MKPYSNDLRRALIAAYETHDYSQQDVADLFGVSPATVRNLVRRKRETGTAGLEALMTIEGATDGPVFQAFVEQVLCPTLQAGDVVVMENLRAHKVAGIEDAIARCGAQLIYLPSYSPDLSPIELGWAKFKACLRRAGARTREALEEAMTDAMESITAADALAWFSHCGYMVI